MAQENVELVQRMLDHFYNGEAEQALECFSPDVEIDLRRRVDAGWGRGREELARLIGEWVSSFADWREEINEVRDLGDQVLVEATRSAAAAGRAAWSCNPGTPRCTTCGMAPSGASRSTRTPRRHATDGVALEVPPAGQAVAVQSPQARS